MNKTRDSTLTGRRRRLLLVWFVNNRRMLQTPEIKHSDTPVCTTTDKDINTMGTESDVKDFFIVGNQLSLGSEGGNVPDGACGVNAAGDD